MQNAPREHSAILSTFIKLPFVFKAFVLSIYLSGCLRQVLLYQHTRPEVILCSTGQLFSDFLLFIHVRNTAGAAQRGANSKCKMFLTCSSSHLLEKLVFNISHIPVYRKLDLVPMLTPRGLFAGRFYLFISSSVRPSVCDRASAAARTARFNIFIPVIHLQFWAYGSWDSLFPISISPNCKLMSPNHYFK